MSMNITIFMMLTIEGDLVGQDIDWTHAAKEQGHFPLIILLFCSLIRTTHRQELWCHYSLKVIAKKLQNSLVSALVLLLDTVVLEISTSGHPAVDLVLKDLDVLGTLELGLELLNLILGLILGGEQNGGDFDVLGVGSVDHGGVA